jgi:hypothetical protein
MLAGMSRRLRIGLSVVAGLQAALAAGFAFEVSAALELWPFGGGQLTNIFVGSIFAAAAASTAWCLVRNAPRALTGIALDYVVILAPLGLYSLVRAAAGADDGARVAAFGVACLLGVGFGVVLLRTGLRGRWLDPRPAPALVLWSSRLFVALLLLVSTLLLVRASVLPWPVTGDQSTAIGLMFLGAAAYFVYGLVEPRWENAGGQLAGFLAYDLVLIGPFLDRLPDVPAEFRVELVIYTVVVAYSGALAAYYLLVARSTRGAAGPDAVEPVPAPSS